MHYEKYNYYSMYKSKAKEYFKNGDFNNTENEQSFNEAIETRRTIYNLEKQYLLVMKN